MRINLKLLFEGYCRSFPVIYGGIYHWGETENLSWLTNSILRFFRSLGESMGFKIALERKNIGSISLNSRGDLFWVKYEEPVLRLECENASVWRHIRKELENLGSSDIPFKVGIFQFVETTLRSRTMQRARNFLANKKLVKNGTKWLLIFDMWYESGIEKIQYKYTDPKTDEVSFKKYDLEWYPLYGMVLGERTDKVTLAKIYRLPFNKIGLVRQEGWRRLP